MLDLHDSGGATIAANDNWMDNSNAAETIATGIAPSDPKESALLINLPASFYTAVLSGRNASSGIGLIELYDLDRNAPAELLNLSTRGFVRSGDDVMIGGTIVTDSPAKLVVRALGPSLSSSGIANSLPDPLLEIHNQDGTLRTADDNWRDTQESDISATGLAPKNDRESAILITLPPGSYTAIVRDTLGRAGVGLVEFYKLQQ